MQTSYVVPTKKGTTEIYNPYIYNTYMYNIYIYIYTYNIYIDIIFKTTKHVKDYAGWQHVCHQLRYRFCPSVSRTLMTLLTPRRPEYSRRVPMILSDTRILWCASPKKKKKQKLSKRSFYTRTHRHTHTHPSMLPTDPGSVANPVGS